MPDAEAITRHYDSSPNENPWVHGTEIRETAHVVPYDPDWPVLYAKLAKLIRDELGTAVLDLDHVGSTAVPGLAAKPVIDIDLTVADSAVEPAYVPALERLGYDLVVREPSWHQHRCLRLESPRANLHVFSPDCPETVRHRLFRDWLRTHPDDCALYARAKLGAVDGVERVTEYNARKQPVIREIYNRAFRAAGLL